MSERQLERAPAMVTGGETIDPIRLDRPYTYPGPEPGVLHVGVVPSDRRMLRKYLTALEPLYGRARLFDAATMPLQTDTLYASAVEGCEQPELWSLIEDQARYDLMLGTLTTATKQAIGERRKKGLFVASGLLGAAALEIGLNVPQHSSQPTPEATAPATSHASAAAQPSAAASKLSPSSPQPSPISPSIISSPSAAPSEAPAPPQYAIDTVLMSANTDGANHTAPGGNKAWKLSGNKRIHITYDLLKKWHVGVASFEEFEHPTAVEFHNLADGEYGQFPRAHSGDDTRNSVVWDLSQFKFVSGHFHKELYFNGRTIKIPVVKLMFKATGQKAWFVAFHNPADTKHYHHQGKYRRHDDADEAKLAARLTKATHLPVFLMGDTNDHRSHYVCTMTNTGLIQSAAGGSNGPETPCAPPAAANTTIDVIMGSSAALFDNFQKHSGSKVHKATDHESYNTAQVLVPFDYVKPLNKSLQALRATQKRTNNQRRR